MPDQDHPLSAVLSGDALKKATGITRGLPEWKERLGAVFDGSIDGLLGALGFPINESKASLAGELLAAGLPFAAGVKALKSAAPIKAFHGSPHDFDQFSLAKIGTGEGAQAYGHGLYFAENEGVARNYRDALSPTGAVTADGVVELPAALQHADPVKDRKEFERVLHQATAEMAQWQKSGLDTKDWMKQAVEDNRRVTKAVQEVLGGAPKANTGKMYEVNIHADPNDFLDWDAPLSQQPPKVKEAANDKFRGQLKTREIGPDLVDVHLYDNGAGSLGVFPKAKVPDVLANPADYLPFKGKQFYQQMESERAVDRGAWNNPSEYASQELHQINGIPGIKYLDGSSRTAGQGTRNYVVFDEKLISIVKKYGIAGAVSAGLLNEAQARQMKQQGYQ